MQQKDFHLEPAVSSLSTLQSFLFNNSNVLHDNNYTTTINNITIYVPAWLVNQTSMKQPMGRF